ncbi:MAG: glucokinase [Deltaproteobacteria bacterium]|nr:glucokinase [Deltaproteobacteria bacterium]
MSPDKKIILAGDIGGTKTELGIFMMGKKRPSLKVFKTFSSVNYSGFDEIVARFLAIHPSHVAGACFGVAGPVINGKCRMTNLPWTISESILKNRFRWKSVHVINDLVAMAHAVPLLDAREVHSLNGLRVVKGRNMGLIAPGTGLGEAFLMFVESGKCLFVSTEGGHCDFPSGNEKQVELWRFLKKKYGHVSVERVVSGPGIVNIYQWLKSSGKYKEPSWLKTLLRKYDPAKVISETALAGKDILCVESMDIFMSVFGAIAGNLALTGMTTGGIFLGGGIVPKILPHIKKGDFMKSFTDKGRFRKFMVKIPVKAILHRRPALLGAACYGFEMLKEKNNDKIT